MTTGRAREEVLAELAAVAARRAASQADVDALYVRQVELYVECHERVDPPVLMKDIAEAAGGTLVGVSAAIKKHKERALANGRGE